jgi:hypothetical protein
MRAMPACAERLAVTRNSRRKKRSSPRRTVSNSTALREERLQNRGAIGGEDASGDFYMMVEARVGEDFEAGADGTALGIVGAVNEARDPGLDNGAGTHAAGLDSDVEHSISKAIVAEKASGFANDDDFGVCGGVAIANGAISRTSQNLSVVDEHGADGDFAGGHRGTRFGERFVHELDLGFHLPPEDNMFHESLYQLSVWWQDSVES